MLKETKTGGPKVIEFTYSEATIRDMGVEPGVEYEVQGQTRHDGLSQNGVSIKYLVKGDENPRTFSLGLYAREAQGFKEGDKIVFRAEIKTLKLNDQKLKALGVKKGDKFTVQKDRIDYEMPGPNLGSYIEVNGQKVYLRELRSVFNSAYIIDETPAGEILTIAPERDYGQT